MKKLLLLLVIPILLLPMIVKADMLEIIPYYNSNVVVGGELEVHIPVNFEEKYEVTVQYDSKILKIDENSITISKPTYEKSENDKCSTFNNVKEVSIKDGVATIKTFMYDDHGCIIDGSSRPEINLRFTAINKGEARVDFNAGPATLIGSVVANVTEVENAKQETAEPTEKVETIGASKKDTTNEIVFYCSLGLNAILIITLPLIAKKCKKAE